MTDESCKSRRRYLAGVVAAGSVTAIAGCSSNGSGDDPTGTDDTGGDTDDTGGDTDDSDGDDGGNDDADDDESNADDESGTTVGDDESTSSDDENGGTEESSGDNVVDVTLTVRGSRSNVDEFQTLQTTFEALEFTATDGSTVRLDDETTDIDLTEVGSGGTVDLFETHVPPGDYESATLSLPIQSATLADGSDPEFQNTDSVSRDVQGDPITVRADGDVTVTATVALLRIAGDGPWTYTLGWGVS